MSNNLEVNSDKEFSTLQVNHIVGNQKDILDSRAKYDEYKKAAEEKHLDERYNQKRNNFRKGAFTLIGGAAGHEYGAALTKKFKERLKILEEKSNLTPEEIKKVKVLKAKIASIKVGSTLGGAGLGYGAGKLLEKKYSKMEDKEYAVKPTKNQTKAVKVKAPTGKMESVSLTRMRKWKRVLVFLKAKKDVSKGKTGLTTWTSGDETQLVKATSRFNKARKMAAPELIKINRAKRSARGRGKKRGSDLSRL